MVSNLTAFQISSMSFLNIIIFGEEGVGKSSVINLIAGKEVAKTTPQIHAGALDFERYEFTTGVRDFRIWETVGLDEPEIGVNGFLRAIECAPRLINDLVRLDGVHLLLFCIRGDRLVTETTRSNYRLFYDVLCKSRVPLALVVTHLEREKKLDEWWMRNANALAIQYQIKAVGCACVTGLPSHRKYEEAAENMDKLLKEFSTDNSLTMPPIGWFSAFLPSFGSFTKPNGLRPRDVKKVLQKRCHFDPQLAEGLANSLVGVKLRVSHSELNIIVFGEGGVGKHSVVDLIAGRAVANRSSDSQGCTLSFTPHSLDVANQHFNIWETLGLVETRLKAEDYLRTIEQTYDLIHSLTVLGGVDLLLFCIHADRVTATTESNYRLFHEVLCKSKVPIVLVITHLEKEDVMENWWTRNAEILEEKGLIFKDHVCVTGLATDSKYGESQASLAQLLESRSILEGTQNRFIIPPVQWTVESLRSFSQFAPLRDCPKRDDITRLLTSHCHLDQNVAEELGQMLSSSLNIILFGETGVGKSSVINLLAKKTIAETSPDVMGCTMSFKAYNFSIGDEDILIWDTVGLEEPTTGAVGYLPAILNTFDLIQDLTGKGGVDLLLFCIRGNPGRITATTQSNYRLFYEVLCRSKVPIALVVTRLEKERSMDDWWERNRDDLENRYGIKSAAHACITGIPGHSKSEDSRINMMHMLKGNRRQGKFTMPPEQWFIDFLRRFGLVAPPLMERAQRKEILKVLKKRCRLNPEIAEELADILQGTSKTKTGKVTADCPNLTGEITRRTEPAAQHGETWQCDWMKGTTPRIVAMKVVIGMNSQKKYRVNLFLRATLEHENVVPLLGVIEKPMEGLVTPWYNNGSLCDYLDHHQELDLSEKKRLLRDVAAGLAYIHNQGVVHGNLHSNNVLIGDTLTARLTDFSFTLPRNFIGSTWFKNYDAIRFADPKLALLAQKCPDHILRPTKECDVYSLGGLMLHVFFGTRPYGELGRLQILQKLLCEERAEIPDPGRLGVPIGYKELIKECWDREEFRRPSPKGLIRNSFY